MNTKAINEHLNKLDELVGVWCEGSSQPGAMYSTVEQIRKMVNDDAVASVPENADQWTDERIIEVIRNAGILCVHPEAKTTLDIARTMLAACLYGKQSNNKVVETSIKFNI